MPRCARKPSESGYHHVIQVGAGRQLLFYNDSDRVRYIDILRAIILEAQIDVLAWCLMSNHVHLIVRSTTVDLSKGMALLGTRYAHYFNTINGHEGPVFNGRYYSEPIESEPYLLQAIRYVHLNPEKANICSAQEYIWSSYRSYVCGGGLADKALVLELLNGVDGFIGFHAQEDTYECSIEYDRCSSAISDERARLQAEELIAPYQLDELKRLEPGLRDSYIQEMKLREIGVRQIQRLTGIGRSTISRA